MASDILEIGIVGKADYAQFAREGYKAGQNFSRSLGRITSDAKQFRQALDASTARVVAFATTTSGIFSVTLAFKKLISSTVELEKSLTDINILFRLGNKDLLKFSSDLFSVANKTGSTFADTAKAAQEFSRQGLSAAETLKRVEAALTLTRLSGLNLETSIASITAIINSFSREALTAVDIVNRLANVDAKFAVSSGDLAEALKRVGSTAEDAGVSLNQVVALVTAAQQVTARGGSIIGNAFKTIFTRLQRPKVLEDLESAGVQTKNLSGETLPLIKILSNLSQTYDSLSKEQKSFVAETVGSVYQINILKAILGDLGSGASIYASALETANSQTAESERRMQELNQTISSQLIRTFNDLTQAASAVGKIVIQPTIKEGLSKIEKSLKTINDTFDSTKSKNLGEIFQGLGKGFSNILSGPGLQIAAFGIIKIFSSLSKYVVNAAKDLGGFTVPLIEQENLEQKIFQNLLSQRDVLTSLKAGQLEVAEAAKLFNSQIILSKNEIAEIYEYSKAIASNISKPVGRASFSIPNLSINSAIKDAISRENKATSGNAVLSQSSNLITPENPLGLAAIDKRIQKNADHAIAQHLYLGQSLPQIKKKGGGIPSLDIGDSPTTNPLDPLLLSINLGFLSSLSRRKGQNSLTSALDARIQELEKAKSNVINSGTASVNSGNGIKVVIGNINDFNRIFGSELEKTRNKFNELVQQQKDRDAKVQGVGLGLAFGGSIAGGLLSQFVGKNNPNAGSAIDQLTTGLVSVGQVLSIFQGNIGKTVAAIIGFNSVINAADSFSKGIEGQKRSLDEQLSKTQKFSASVDTIIGSLTNLNTLYLDSSASLEAINREQQKLSDSLAEISQIGPEGPHIAARVQSSSDLNEKIRGLNLARELENRKLGEQSGLFQIAQLGAERSLFGKFSGFSGGIFAGASEAERTRALSVIKGNASNVISSLTDEQRQGLINNLGTSSGFVNALSSNSVASAAINQIKSSGGTAQDVNLLVDQIRILVNQINANQNPETLKTRQTAILQTSTAQTNVNLATQNVAAFRKLFLNSGSLLAENAIDIKNVGARDIFNRASVNEAQRRAEAGILGITAGDKTLAANDLSIELEKINAEKELKSSSLRNQTASKIFSTYGQNIDEFTKGLGPKDVGLKTDNAEISKFNESVIKGINSGLASVSKENFNQFFNSQGGFDFKSFEDKVLANSGASNEGVSGEIKKFLEARRGSDEILKEIKDLNNQQVELSQDSLKEAQIAQVKFNAIVKELDTRRQANFLGGNRLLTDRNFQREVQRDITRGRYLAQNGVTLEQRGQGAALLLDSFKKLGRNPLELSRVQNGRFIPANFSKESQEAAQLLNLQKAGLQYTQERIGRNLAISAGSGQFSTSVTSQFLTPIIAQRKGLDNLASTAVAAENRPELLDIIKSATDQSKNSINAFSSELDSAKKKIFDFGEELGDLGSKLKQAEKELDSSREELSKVSERASKAVENAIKNSSNPNVPKEITSPDKANIAKLVQSATSTILVGGGISLAAYLKSTPQSRAAVFGNIKDNLTSLARNTKIAPVYNKLGDIIAEGLIGPNSIYGSRKIREVIQRTPASRDTSSSDFNPRFAQKQNLTAYATEKQYQLFGGRTVPFKGPNLPVIPFAKGEELYNQIKNLSVPDQFLPGGPKFIGPVKPPIIAPKPGNFPSIFSDKRGINSLLTVPQNPSVPFVFGGKSYGNSTSSFSVIPQLAGVGASASFTFSPPPKLSANLANEIQSSIQVNQVGGINTKFGKVKNAGFISLQALAQGGALLGSTALGIGGGIGGSILGEKLIGDQYGIGALLGGTLGSTVAGGIAAKGLGGLFAGGQTAGAALGASPLLGALAIGATAYGGFKGGNALFKALNSSSFSGISEGTTDAYLKTAGLVRRGLSSGKSSEDIKKIIDAQIATTQSQISTAKSGILGNLGLGKETSDLAKAVEELKALRESVDAQKEQVDSSKKQEEFQSKMLAALEKLAGTNATTNSSTISVEISLKDIDKLPEIFSSKIVKPLEEQLKGLQNRLSNTEQKVGVNPQPASI